MKKIFLLLFCFFSILSLAKADLWDILSIKNQNTPVFSVSSSDSTKKIATLQSWYIVADLWKEENWFVYVMLTDNKRWYIDKNQVVFDYQNTNKIYWNIWEVRSNWVLLKSLAFEWSETLASLKSNDKIEFTHTNFINWNWARWVMVTWDHVWKTWYIERKNINIYNFQLNQNTIKQFINNYNDIKYPETSSNPGVEIITTTVIKDTHIDYIRYLKKNFPIKYIAFLEGLKKLRETNKSEYLKTISYISKYDKEILNDLLKYISKPTTQLPYTWSYTPVRYSKSYISDKDIDSLRNLKLTNKSSYLVFHDRLNKLKTSDLSRYNKIIAYFRINAPELLPENINSTPGNPALPPLNQDPGTWTGSGIWTDPGTWTKDPVEEFMQFLNWMLK